MGVADVIRIKGDEDIGTCLGNGCLPRSSNTVLRRL